MYLKRSIPIPEANGKISRQTTKSGTYIHYVFERSYNPQKRHTIPKRTIIGKLAPDGVSMFPNEKFFDFFPNVPMPELRSPAPRSSLLMAGSYIVIKKIIGDYKLNEIAAKHFGDKAGLFLDLSAYMIVEEQNQGQYYPDYAYRHLLFSKGMCACSDATVSSFLSSITDNQIIGFLDDWNASRDHRSRIYISYDSTNKNSQAGDIDLVEFGKAKNEQGLPIFNCGLAFDKTNSIPLFYELYPGSITDVSQLKCLVDKAIAYGYRHVGFILDRGYFSQSNIQYMDANHYHFIIMVKGCKPLVASLIDRVRGTFETRRDCSIPQRHINGITVESKLYEDDEKVRYFHVFYNPMKMALERKELEEHLEQAQKAFERSIGQKVTFGKAVTDYFTCHYDKQERFLFATEKVQAVEAALARCGYFCIVSSEKMSAEEAYLLYRGRDVSEKIFCSDKTFLGSKSMRVHSASAMAAKMLIEFVGLIIRQRLFTLLKKEMMRLPVKRNYMTVPAAIRELDKIEIIRISEKSYQLDHAITKSQEMILKAVGISKDDAMREITKVSKVLVQSDGLLEHPKPNEDAQIQEEHHAEA